MQAINLDAERLGADVNAYTGKDSTGYFMTGLGQHAPQLLRMTADIVPPRHLPASRTAARTGSDYAREAIEYDEDPEDSSSDLLDRALWGDAPWACP